MEKKQSLFPLIFIGAFLLGGCHSSKKATKSAAEENAPQMAYMPSPENHPQYNTPPKLKKKNPAPAVETEDREGAIVDSYADKLGVSKSDITNYSLYNFIDLWYGTPYKYAGRSKSGVDCSDFVSLLFESVYNVTLSGAVPDIYKQCKPIKSTQLKEGDLVFFKINKRSLSHVGVYLQNHKFVHASVHSGVVIDDLKEDYYKKYYRAAGRLLK